ncbi:hypothetical protein NQ314_014037 [Rhamnusium bicolor]|uniref:Glutamate dehydrogenase n=1 Tax=Rhamnusium bicolor TaxID=1586634 RepID=A0AAV8X4E6_9CUCU|nr:hypothetical protein NQ314_014037 [Rhamnusium bicolor]
MAFIANYKVVKIKNIPFSQSISTLLPYEIPERYRNSFYLANAAFFDSTNWFLHRAYEVIFPTLKKRLSELEPYTLQSNNKVAEKVEQIVRILDQCNSVIDVRFPFKRDDGSYEVVRGFRAHHGLTTGYASCLGGLRINENITRDHMKALSVLSTYRNACMGINMAGAHGGIKICPKNYSENELQNIVELYTAELIKKGYCTYNLTIGGERDVIQPDINTSEREMSWISTSFAKYTGQSLNVAAAGKPSEYGGIENYEKMSSHGTFLTMDFFLNNEPLMTKIGLTKGMKGKTFIIQGLGKLGAPLSNQLVYNGAVCVGVKEKAAYIYDPNGINLNQLYEHKAKTGSIENFGPCKAYENDSIYTEQCDILIFAAHQKSLICYIANDVKAKMIVEAADGPISPTSHKILTGRSKLVVPDIYACSGATIASYLEYLKNMNQMRICQGELLRFSRNVYENILNRISEEEQKIAVSGSSVQSVSPEVHPSVIADSVEYVLTDTSNEIVRLLDLHQLRTDIRTAAYMVAIENIFSTLFYQKKFL